VTVLDVALSVVEFCTLRSASLVDILSSSYVYQKLIVFGTVFNFSCYVLCSNCHCVCFGTGHLGDEAW